MIAKLKKIINKNSDLIYYTTSFALYTFIQQVVLMPYLSKHLSSTNYSFIILFLTIFNILCYAIGDEIGNTKLLMVKKYKDNNIKNGDQNILLMISLIFVCIVISVVIIVCKLNLMDAISVILITLLGIFRHYILAYAKIFNRYRIILYIFILYCIGIISGISVNIIFNLLNPFLIFLLGEVLSFIYYVFVIYKLDRKCYSLIKSELITENSKTYFSLFAISLIFNLLSYVDRLVIYPLLGSTSMNTYYAATTMSKFASLIITPVSNIMLARLATSSKNYLTVVKKTIKKYFLIVIVMASIICVVMSFIGVKILYEQYFIASKIIMVPVGIAMAFTIVSAILKPIILKYYPTGKFLLINVLYSLTILITIFLSFRFKMIGFSYGVMISKIILLTSYLICIYRIKEDINE